MGTAMSPSEAIRTCAVGIVLPVHNEEELLSAALGAIEVAADALPAQITCRVLVVLDDCDDGSADLAHSWGGRVGALVSSRASRSVGIARGTGIEELLSLWADVDPAAVWIANTDADSRVPGDWLTVQLGARSSGADLWAGRVRVAENGAIVAKWKKRYLSESSPIHGANLGFSGALYGHIGGFRNLRSGEDRDLHCRAVAAGFRVKHDLKATVMTSARRIGRAPDGFASVIRNIEREQIQASA
jgi:glycosyltransferase involved in cell wall biosynthesis